MKTSIKTAIIALALAVTVSASAEGYQFNKNLTVGSRGADVSALQAALGVTPATGYFGGITKAAVKAYQTSKGISATGFVGPLTRASMNMMAPTVPGTTPTTPVVLNGQEGFGEYRLSTTPVDNSNITTMSDVSVYGVEVKAKNADISVERLTLNVAVSTSNGTENPSTLINKVTVKDGSTVLATLPVNSSTFSKYTGTSNYYVQISGLSTRVAKDTIKNITVSFDTNPIDTPRNVTVGISGDGIRVVDGRGISTYNPLAITNRVHTFKKAGAAVATLQYDSVIVYASNYKVDTNNGARNQKTSTFAVKSQSGSSKITSVDVTVASVGGTAASAVYLYEGSNLLASRSITGTTTASFDIENNSIMVVEDQTKTFTITVDVPSSATSTTVQTTVNKVAYEKADGTATSTSATISGPVNYFAKIVPMFTKVSSSNDVNLEDGKVTSLVSTFVVDVQPDGGDLSTTTTAVLALVNAAGSELATTTAITGALADSGLTSIGQGSVRRMTFANGFATTTVAAGVQYKAIIKSITWSPLGGTAITQSNAFNGLDTGFRIR
jgi:peptidoglycan hydrolase-like protein with peptidoglycan-binding domain